MKLFNNLYCLIPLANAVLHSYGAYHCRDTEGAKKQWSTVPPDFCLLRDSVSEVLLNLQRASCRFDDKGIQALLLQPNHKRPTRFFPQKTSLWFIISLNGRMPMILSCLNIVQSHPDSLKHWREFRLLTSCFHFESELISPWPSECLQISICQLVGRQVNALGFLLEGKNKIEPISVSLKQERRAKGRIKEWDYEKRKEIKSVLIVP